MAHKQVSIDDSLWADQPKVTKCRCGTPQLIRFGDAVVCSRDDCLTAWVWTQAKKYGPARYFCNKIHSRGLQTWTDFLQFFRVFAWRQVAEKGFLGVNHYDIVDACRRYITTQHWQEIPTPEHQESYEAGSSETEEEDLDQQALVDDSIDSIVQEAKPFTDALANEILRRVPRTIEGKVTVLVLADIIAPEDSAILLGVQRQQAMKEVETAHLDLIEACM